MNGLLYFEDGKLVVSEGDVRIYEMNNELFLEMGRGHNLWALESEVHDYIEQLWDLPRGNCLEIGLGLGVASRCILTQPAVTSLTTVEKNPDVIVAQRKISHILDDGTRDSKWLRYDSSRHRIINSDGLVYMYQTKRKYDFIFIDFYSHIDEETLPAITDMVNAAKRVLAKDGTIICWLDKYTPLEYVEPFFNLFKEYIKDGKLTSLER